MYRISNKQCVSAVDVIISKAITAYRRTQNFECKSHHQSCVTAYKKKTKAKKMSFPYLICLDFEATCWSGYFDKTNSEIIGKFVKSFLNNEIVFFFGFCCIIFWKSRKCQETNRLCNIMNIAKLFIFFKRLHNFIHLSEFGAVLLNTDTGEIENQFHHYVRPTLFPKLSSFCINLTGIKQFMVNDQDPFPGVLKKFHNWIKKMQNEKGLRFATSTEKHVTVDGPNVTFCSWSDFDLDFFFKQDCRRADIDVLPYFKAWVDGRQIFNVSITQNSPMCSNNVSY